MKPRPILLLITLLFAGISLGMGQNIGEPSHLKPSLTADTNAVVPGKPFMAGVLLKMDPGWHTYWRFSGDSGGRPQIEWKLPPGFRTGEIEWPLPRAHMDEGDMLTYIYEEEAMLMVPVIPPATVEASEVTLTAQLSWLVCEQTCIPGDGEVSLTLPVAEESVPANTGLFNEWRGRTPQRSTPPFPVKWDLGKAGVIQVVASLGAVPSGTKVEFFPLPPEKVTVEHPKVSEAAPDGTRTITLAYSAEGPVTQPWMGVIALEPPGGRREGWTISSGATAPGARSGDPLANAPPAPAAGAATVPAPSKSLLAMLGIAFLGGLVLNIMPCVLPVIALKIFGFVNQAQESRERIFRLGLAFVAGVFVFFMALAAVAIILGRSFNWGYQFQNPYILTGLIALVFVFALNMVGVFEVTLGSGTASKLSELSNKEGYSGAFLHGMFTTLLGTSCTAPFLAPSLGYATTQPPGTVILLFVAIATGMSLPYFLLTANPAWLRYVPKPGMWMERVKQVLGFVVMAVAVWLLTVLYSTHGSIAGTGVTWYLLALGIAAWAVGAFPQKRGIIGVLAATALAGWFMFIVGPLGRAQDSPATTAVAVEKGGIPWLPWSDEAVQQGIAQGQPVFVDFTADWCINCKFFERTVLETDAVRAALRDKGVLALKADWTKPNPEIRAALGRFGRAGVPLYVLYRPGQPEPLVMDALTKSGFLETLSSLLATPASMAAVK
jgi:thiol:disulfide interchange protein